MTRAVSLSRRLILERAVSAPDGAGGFAKSWEVLGTVWAQVTARGARERDGGEVSLSSAKYRILMRGAPVGSEARPTPECRLREGARIFTIQAVTDDDARGRYLICHAIEEGAS